MAVGRHNPLHFGNQVQPQLTAVAELIMAVACAALALEFLLDGLVFARSFAKSIRPAISGIVANGFVAAILASCAVALGVTAIRNWLRL